MRRFATTVRWTACALGIVAAGLQIYTPALIGGDLSGQQDSTRDSSAATIDPVVVQRFFDSLVPGQLQEHAIPGAAVSVVQDGRTIFARGYGLARVDGEIPVDAETTQFRIASVSKLFTWTAVMQLVESNQLDLETDVNQYLSGFQIPGGYSQPVTLGHLMSHSAGFEDRGLIGTLADSPEGVVSLQRYLADNIPARLRPPGVVSAYSNYGGALAGHIVSEVSGLPYDQYVRENIFEPLGMAHATARHSATGNDMASSYTWRDGIWQAIPNSWVIPVPDGGIRASALDMSRFMIAHLEGGQPGPGAILSRETVQQMHRQSFTHHPQLPGWAHGFQEEQVNGHRILEHGGYLQGFSSLLVLIPSQRAGLFVSFNSRPGGRAGREIKRQFMDRFLPGPSMPDRPAAQAPVKKKPGLDRYVGVYAPCRSSQTSIAKIGTLMQAARVTADEDRSISFLGTNWLPYQTDLLQSQSGLQLLAMQEDQDGRAEYLFIGRSAWMRLPWYQLPVFHFALLGSCLLVFLSTLIAGPIVHWRARRSRRATPVHAASETPTTQVAWWMACLCSIINLVFIVVLAVILSGDTSALEFGVPVRLRLLLLLPFVSALLAAIMVAYSLMSWKRKRWGRFARVSYICVCMASVAFVWFLGFWNLLGWHF